MTSKRMLIDAIHPEETRVVVLSNDRLEDFEVEAADRKQLKGNIYLAKVTRVEPSLQAAFVDYGGNRHGFLAFSEIHPDYYQIPVSDREKLMAEQQAAEREAQEAEDADAEAGEGRRRKRKAEAADGESEVEVIDGEEGEDVPTVRRQASSFRNYKIQEVIKRRQIMLVQVVKEERGSKGAALTTYLSLAGRYCVLMPNTARGGGISRKISNAKDRTRLKSVLKEMEIPEGMAVIVRTAGAERNKTEIKRDCTYLLRLWESVRSLTLESIAPALVYEEANLIKRTIRDLYANDFEDIIVDGEEGYQTARTFMRLLMPSHAKRVKVHDPAAVPLFQQYKVEQQLHGIYNPDVSLPSGGYIVINPTEALVSIDVNSGRATRERNIEETALKTNLEAADEVARQLRLRELAGLVVIDFIDMDNPRNQANVERRIKTAMRNDRARIQIGRISAFGLLELSRQRLHPSLFETSFEPVPHSTGVGYRRTVASASLAALRALESEGAQGRANELQVHIPTSVALYILNHKRGFLSAIEGRHGVAITFKADDSLTPPELRIDRLKSIVEPPVEPREVAETVENAEEETNADGTRRRRRRRRGRRNEKYDESPESVAAEGNEATDDEDEDEDETEAREERDDDEAAEADVSTEEVSTEEPAAEERSADDGEGRGRRRRRGRRGGRRRGREPGDEREAEETQAAADDQEDEPPVASEEPAEDVSQDAAAEPTEEEGEKRPRRRRRRGRGSRSAEAAAETDADGETARAEPDLLDMPQREAETPPQSEPAYQAEAASADAEPAPERVEQPPYEAPAYTDATGGSADDGEAAAADAQRESQPAEDDQAEPESFTSQPAEGGTGGGEDSEDNVLVRTRVVGEEENDQPRRRGWWQRLVR